MSEVPDRWNSYHLYCNCYCCQHYCWVMLLHWCCLFRLQIDEMIPVFRWANKMMFTYFIWKLIRLMMIDNKKFIIIDYSTIFWNRMIHSNSLFLMLMDNTYFTTLNYERIDISKICNNYFKFSLNTLLSESFIWILFQFEKSSKFAKKYRFTYGSYCLIA